MRLAQIYAIFVIFFQSNLAQFTRNCLAAVSRKLRHFNGSIRSPHIAPPFLSDFKNNGTIEFSEFFCVGCARENIFLNPKICLRSIISLSLGLCNIRPTFSCTTMPKSHFTIGLYPPFLSDFENNDTVEISEFFCVGWAIKQIFGTEKLLWFAGPIGIPLTVGSASLIINAFCVQI